MAAPLQWRELKGRRAIWGISLPADAPGRRASSATTAEQVVHAVLSSIMHREGGLALVVALLQFEKYYDVVSTGAEG